MAKNNIQIIYQDADILLVNKPSGVSVTADRSGLPDLQQILPNQLTTHQPLRLVHRIDKDTSGILLLAKHLQAQSFYCRCFTKRTIDKLYLALVFGIPSAEAGTITAPIARTDPNRQTVQINPRHGKTAITDWRLLAQFGHVALLAVRPRTGRTHQIRVHLHHASLPLAIDPLYAAKQPLMLSSFKTDYKPKPDREEPPLIDRLTLHAYQLSIPSGTNDPTAKTFVAPLDKKFAAAIKMLAKYTSPDPLQYKMPPIIRQILEAQVISFDREPTDS